MSAQKKVAAVVGEAANAALIIVTMSYLARSWRGT
jgi:hypothetical protein